MSNLFLAAIGLWYCRSVRRDIDGRALTRSLNQREIRVHLYPIEYDFRAGGRDVEVANDEVRRKLGKYALRARPKIEEREVLVADFTAENHEGLRIAKKPHPPRAARQHHAWQRIRSSIRGGGSQRKGCPDIRARVHQESAIGRPDRIDGILGQQRERRVAI